ncbi:MAG TPA: hypothetical protein PLF40_01685 [Kofleriaceae bacterium]|nr:hypothetical protein [Kofleriaceae bacterium]
MKIKGFAIAGILGVSAAVCVRWAIGTAPTKSAPTIAKVDNSGRSADLGALVNGPSRLPTIVRVKQKDLSPTDSRYDAVRLLDEEDGKLTMAEVYEAEPRDPLFAPILEKRMQVTIANVLKALQLSEKITATSVTCRTLSCIATFSIASADADSVYSLLGYVPLAEVRGPGLEVNEMNPDVSEISMKLFYSADQRDDAAFRAWQQRTLWPRVEILKRQQNEAHH